MLVEVLFNKLWEDINGPRAWEATRANVGQQFAYSQLTTTAGIKQGVGRHFLSQPIDSARQTGFDWFDIFHTKTKNQFQ